MNYYLIDNGESHDDHSIYFVKSIYGPNLVGKLLDARNAANDRNFLVFAHFNKHPVSSAMEWSDLDEIFYPDDLTNGNALTEEAKKIPKNFLRALAMDYQKRWPRGGAQCVINILDGEK